MYNVNSLLPRAWFNSASENPSMGFPSSSAGKKSTCNAGDPGSIPGSGSFPGGRIGYLL